jgi:hypothetical protein
MEQIISKELAENLLKIKGEGRGVHFKNDAEYVLKERGEEALKKVEEEITRLGFPIKYREIKNTGFYPAGLRAISLLAIKKTLSWDDEKMKDMFKAAVGASLIVRLFMKFFYPTEKAINALPRIWDQYWTKGNFSIVEFNRKEKKVIVRIEGLDLHPLYCSSLEGFFMGMADLIGGSKRRACKEISCSFKDKNSKTHDYLLTWE